MNWWTWVQLALAIMKLLKGKDKDVGLTRAELIAVADKFLGESGIDPDKMEKLVDDVEELME